MTVKLIETPLTKEVLRELKAGDVVSLTGTVYTGRDAAHKRMMEALNKGEALPFDIKDSIIYYVGPTPAKPGKVIGSAGPTTSYRMDTMTIPLLELGLGGMIGKGLRSKEVIESMKKNETVYFAAVGGAGALIASSVKESEVIAYDDLGTEAIRKLTVENMPLIVCIDIYGNNLYENTK
ncbi:fumarate hydratase subunit beta [Proteiniborus ethanoligenes]|uniref:Fumarate hydratase subunit beta n=1 Tax=Proteiniborus ethanoligenes TaxID=415015 RepID=A0A1H3LFM8_9FIRM|nr:Fe-S-containing hydro-lyase [Proteiniborus ethanoligenes]SDY63181.1 fumarate hydratase subunit beta [Proteiniborus ethanoligenes]